MFLSNPRSRAAAIKRLRASYPSTRHFTHSASLRTRSVALSLSTLRRPTPFLSSHITTCTTLSIPPYPALEESRTYSTCAPDQNTAQGTIGRGASGVADEARREREALRTPDHLNEQERMIFEKLDHALEPVRLEVQDISGGCGSMYGIEIVSERFRGLSMLKQQRLVNEVLGEEIKGWHGVQLKTRVP